MKPTDWKIFAEFVGIGAIVASLIFVGLQLKQSQEIALSQVHLERASGIVEQIISTSENPYYLSAIAKYDAGSSEAMTPVEYQALQAVGNAAIYSLEDAFYQHRRGFLSDERWQASRETIRWFLSGEGAGSLRA